MQRLKILCSDPATNKLEFLDAGVSTNWVYVSLREPTNGVPLYHTVVHLACAKPGATDDRTAVEQTWSFFVDRRLKTWDGFPLYYYGTEAPPADSTGDSSGLLLANHDGDCDSFAWLLYDALQVNAVRGIALSHVHPAPGNDALAVKEIAFNEPGTFPTELYYKYARSDLDVSPAGLAGQNMDPPREKRFYYHRVIHWATDQSYLDPSYGTPFQTEAQYAEKIDAWGKGRGNFWRKASGSLLNPVFSDD